MRFMRNLRLTSIVWKQEQRPAIEDDLGAVQFQPHQSHGSGRWHSDAAPARPAADGQAGRVRHPPERPAHARRHPFGGNVVQHEQREHHGVAVSSHEPPTAAAAATARNPTSKFIVRGLK